MSTEQRNRQSVYFSYDSAVLPPENHHLFDLGVRVKAIEKLRGELRLQAKSSGLTDEDMSRNLALLPLLAPPMGCEHIAWLRRPAKGIPTDLDGIYYAIDGSPQCILCGCEVLNCPRCLSPHVGYHLLASYDSWRGADAQHQAALMGLFTFGVGRVMQIHECYECGFASVILTDDWAPYLK